MPNLYDLTAAESARAIRDGDTSAVELVSALLERSRDLEPSLNVWVTLDEDAALDAARSRDRELASDGPRGPLHGVPVGVKDIYYTRGVLTTACSRILADFVPDYDSTAVAKLRQAGAIILGKTVTTEFANGDPPPTINPWDAERTPGGSSSGSAVGVAARMFPVALGSQTAGSVLRPASFNGVVGLKPTFGRISRYGVVPVAASLDTMGTHGAHRPRRRAAAGRHGRTRPARPRLVRARRAGLRRRRVSPPRFATYRPGTPLLLGARKRRYPSERRRRSPTPGRRRGDRRGGRAFDRLRRPAPRPPDADDDRGRRRSPRLVPRTRRRLRAKRARRNRGGHEGQRDGVSGTPSAYRPSSPARCRTPCVLSTSF